VGRAAVALAVLWAAVSAAAAAAANPLVRPLGRAEVDWSAGVVSARGAAAADLRLPGVEAARPAATREARVRAARVLREALVKLPLRKGKHPSAGLVDAALERASVIAADPQSNGGVLVTLGVRFGDLGEERPAPAGKGARPPEPPAPEVVLSVPSMPLEAMPVLLVGKAEIPLASAVYRLGPAPKGDKPVAARRDRAGRLVVPAGKRGGKPALDADSLRGGARAVIYVRAPAGR
jgi:hypothetical protein